MGYPGDESRRPPYHSPDTTPASPAGPGTGPFPGPAADAHGTGPAWPSAGEAGSPGPSWGGTGRPWESAPAGSPGSPDPYGSATPYGAADAGDPYGTPGSTGPFPAPGTTGPLSAPTPADGPSDLFRPARPARSSPPYGMPGSYGAPDPFAAPAPGTGDPARPYGAADPWSAPAGGAPSSFPSSFGTPPSFGVGPVPERPSFAASGGTDRPDPADRSPDPVAVPPRPRRSWVRPVAYSVTAVVLLGAAAGGLYAVAQRNAAATSAVDDPSPAASAHVGLVRPQGKYGFAASRKTDPTPLTAKELFPKVKVTSGGRTYLLRARRVDKKCKDAVVGEKIQKAVTAARCTQLIRASFQDSTGKIIGTIGVANLSTSAGAKRVATAGAAKERKDYVKPLQGKSGPTKALGTGEALAGAWTHGHYAVLLWFQFKDGHKPSAAETKRLNRAASEIADKTVFPALDTRALTGAPG